MIENIDSKRMIGFASLKTHKEQIGSVKSLILCLQINPAQVTLLKPLAVANAYVVPSKHLIHV